MWGGGWVWVACIAWGVGRLMWGVGCGYEKVAGVAGAGSGRVGVIGVSGTGA